MKMNEDYLRDVALFGGEGVVLQFVYYRDSVFRRFRGLGIAVDRLLFHAGAAYVSVSDLALRK